MLKRPELAVCTDDLKTEIKRALEWARNARFRAVDIGAVTGPISPAELSHTGRRHFLKHVGDLGLRVGSLRGPVGGPGYSDRAAGEHRLKHMQDILRLAQELHVPVVSTDVGYINPKDTAAQGRLREALETLANAADRVGVIATIETSGIGADELQKVLADLRCPNLACCCDSGAMLMRGDNPHAVGSTLPGLIRLVRARDAIAGSPEGPGRETAMGQGHLDLASFVAGLTESGFSGDIVLTRSSSSTPGEDLLRARESFNKLFG